MGRNNPLPEVTDEQWQSVNKKNRDMVEEFIRESSHLSKQSVIQYVSAIKIFFYWIKENAENKNFYDIKSRDYLFYQNYLSRFGLSSSAIKLKRSVISSFNNYIETYYLDTFPTYRNYITKRIPSPPKIFVYEKKPPTLEEYAKICKQLEENEHWQELAYLKFTFSTGARREEVRQLLKEIITYEPKVRDVEMFDEQGNKVKKQSKFYVSHDIRCKGRTDKGKVRKLQFDEESFLAIKKWIEKRKEDDCEYVFVNEDKKNNIVEQIGVGGFNYWNKKLFEPILGRRVHPHAWREARATSIVVEQKKDISVAQKLLGHDSSSTTEIYVIRDNDNASDEAFVN